MRATHVRTDPTSSPFVNIIGINCNSYRVYGCQAGQTSINIVVWMWGDVSLSEESRVTYKIFTFLINDRIKRVRYTKLCSQSAGLSTGYTETWFFMFWTLKLTQIWSYWFTTVTWYLKIFGSTVSLSRGNQITDVFTLFFGKFSTFLVFFFELPNLIVYFLQIFLFYFVFQKSYLISFRTWKSSDLYISKKLGQRYKEMTRILTSGKKNLFKDKKTILPYVKICFKGQISDHVSNFS